jgi:phage recombination protein Bet
MSGGYDAASLVRYAPPGVIDPAVWLDLVKRTVLGTDQAGRPRSNEDLALFLMACQRTKLDPLARQIYAVYRWEGYGENRREKMVIQTSIDGFRLIAQRTGQYGGQDDVIFWPEDESTPHPTKARVTVYRLNPKTGERMPIPASARWDEYAPYNSSGQLTGPIWKKMPYLMLGKVAEALALRKAFPQELSGLYTSDEFGGDTVATEPEPYRPDEREMLKRTIGSEADLAKVLDEMDPQPRNAGAPVAHAVPPGPQPEPPTIDGTATVVTTPPAGNGNGNGTAKKGGAKQATVAPAAIPAWKEMSKELAARFEHYRFADGSPNAFQLALSAKACGFDTITLENLNDVTQKLADRAQSNLAGTPEAATTEAGSPA